METLLIPTKLVVVKVETFLFLTLITIKETYNTTTINLIDFGDICLN